ncbi:MAG: hypothetical protein GQ546_02425 [Gammaproteobacteria bacterium]|nr:hypothetical protein [Gammaproteobacteria bacterium]
MENNKNKLRCLKCGFYRPEDATNPEWQCPNCLSAYSKIEKYEQNISIFNSEREKAKVLGLTEYFFLVLLNVGLFLFSHQL